MASTPFEAGSGNGGPTVRPGDVDGSPFLESRAPQSSGELAEILKEASSFGRAVTPVGGGTKLNLGNVPGRIDLALSTANLQRVLHYEPTDMTLSVEAGARFADVQARLRERGQGLPLDVVDPEDATIGGLIATAQAGPRRLGSGTLRDLLIGISVAYPDGTIGNAGGLVVKNVTGFDLMRLHLGALGTLGVIVAANFKVLPLARAEVTVVSEPATLPATMQLANATRKARVRPIALELFTEHGSWRCAARFEGRPRTIELGTTEIVAILGNSSTLRDQESADWWQRYMAQHSLRGNAHVLIRCAAIPKSTAELIANIELVLRRHDLTNVRLFGSPFLGAIHIKFDSDALARKSLVDLQSELLAIAQNVTVLAAPANLKREIDVWGHAPATISVMRALKAEFDPTNTINAGRFVDRM